MTKIRIANPRKGGSAFTSPERADYFVRRGEARFLADGRLQFTKRGGRVAPAPTAFNPHFNFIPTVVDDPSVSIDGGPQMKTVQWIPTIRRQEKKAA